MPIDPEAVPDAVSLPLVPYFPPREAALRLGASWAALGVCATASLLVQLGLLLLRSRLTSRATGGALGAHVLAGVANALAVEAMGAAFRPLVGRLVRWQNHRTAAAQERAYALQLFSLAFVNRFGSLGYLALLKPIGGFALFHSIDAPGAIIEVCRGRDGAPSASCSVELATQAGALVLTACVLQNLVEAAAAALAARRRAAPLAGRVACEATLDAPGTPGEDFSELAMSYAMVALFAGAFPPAAALALLNNAVEARVDAFRFLRCAQRPLPQRGALVGAWREVLQLIAVGSIVTNTVLVCHTYTSLPAWLGYAGGARYSLTLVLEHALLLAKLAVDGLIPDVPAARLATLAKQRKLLRYAELARSPPAPSGGHAIFDAAAAADAAALAP